jgi:hypothetical protein
VPVSPGATEELDAYMGAAPAHRDLRAVKDPDGKSDVASLILVTSRLGDRS